MPDFYALDTDEQVSCLRAMAAESLKAWNMEASTIELIKYRENAVFKIILADGTHYALRIHRPGYHSDESLRSEILWIKALEAYGMKVPELLPTVEGDFFTTVEIKIVPEPRQIDLLEWLNAEQLGSVEEGLGDDPSAIRHTYGTLGELAATMHKQASSWSIPDNLQRHAWDMDGLVGEEPLWGRFWELEALNPEQRKLLIKLRDSLKSDLAQYDQSAEHYGFIHADLVPENVLVNGESIRVIDFDDAGFGWYLFDIATVLYFIVDDPHYQIAFDALIQGYRTLRPLSDEQLLQLPMFLAARGMTYLGWVHTRHETETARELTPLLIDMACKVAIEYLNSTVN